MSIPAPIIVEPSGKFIGNDGNWSAFEIEVGVPAQKVQVLPSSQISQTLVIVPGGCVITDPSNCTKARGGTFDSTESKNWTSKNNYPLGVEVNLGFRDSDYGAFGYDTLAISTTNGENTNLGQQLISGVATKDFFIGSLGLNSAPMSFANQGQAPDIRPSLMSSLMSANLIPSLSYGYTAGASYRNQNASLTLGGYDASRLVPNDVSIELAPNSLRQLVVALKSITFTDSDSSDKPLLSKGILTLIDSTVPEIWLPLDACLAFESAFGMEYDPIANRYLINNTIHGNLHDQNASVTFELGSSVGSGPSVNITLPYASFDQYLDDLRIMKKPSRYFPLRRAADDTQLTLGRSLLQESFLIVDYGSNNFSISQTVDSSSPHVVAISASNVTGTSPSAAPTASSTSGPAIVKTVNHNGFPVAAIAGIVVALILVTLVCGGLFIWKKTTWWRKPRHPQASELGINIPYPKNHKEVDGSNSGSSCDKKDSIQANEFPIPTGMESPRFEAGGNQVYFEGFHNSNGHGVPLELPTEPIPRSELSSPEPVSRQASPTPDEIAMRPELRPELHSCDPHWSLTEMASPSTSSAHPSPPLDVPSALSSPRWPRPGMGSRRSAHDRFSSSASDDSGFLPIQRINSQSSGYGKDGQPLRPPHARKDSDESHFTQDTLPMRRPSQLRKISSESGFTMETPTIPRPTNLHRTDSTDSDPLMSPRQDHHAPQGHHRHAAHSPESSAMETPMEEDINDSDSPLCGGDTPEVQSAQLARRSSPQLINQMSPPTSPSKVLIPRKEVASSHAYSHSHSRQESSGERREGGPPVAFNNPNLGSGFRGRVRSSSSGSRFEERFSDDGEESK